MTAGLIWVFINIILPITAPVAGMWFERLSAKTIRDAAQRKSALRSRRTIVVFKDGQLGWVGLVMCFAAMSEFIDGARKHGLPEIAMFVLIAAIALAFANGHFASKGAAESTRIRERFFWRSFTSDYPIALYTTAMTGCSAVMFGFIHFWAQ